MKTSVFAFIFNKNKVLLVKHSYRDGWLPPGGRRDKGENIEETVIREVKEEANLNIKVTSFTSLSINAIKNPKNEKEIPLPFYIVNGKSHKFYFIAKTSKIKDLEVDGLEIVEAKFFTLEEVKKNKDISKFTKEQVYFLFDYLKIK